MTSTQRSPEAHDYHKWYKRKVWLTIREAQLAKQPLCERHLARGEEVLANTVNHRTPHNGDWMAFVSGPFDSVCGPCHSSEVQSEEKLGYRKGVDEHGFPIDPAHPWKKVG